jgi:hypothetical protein
LLIPSYTQAVFGTGPFTHWEASGWLLETTAANTLRLRRTGNAGASTVFSMVAPVSCTGSPISGTQSSVMNQVNNITFNVGQTLTATFCGEGSTIRVTVFDEFERAETSFRCWRLSGNSNACIRDF